LVRRPTLTAPARDGLALPRVGTKKRAFRSNKETDEGQDMRCTAELLDKTSPIQGLTVRKRRARRKAVSGKETFQLP
jgi:hypothetical protein